MLSQHTDILTYTLEFIRQLFFNDFDVGFDLMKEKKQVLYGIYGVGSMGSIKQNKIHIRLIEIASWTFLMIIFFLVEQVSGPDNLLLKCVQ